MDRSRRGPRTPYRGGDTPSSFGNPAAELRALLEGCGLFDMSWQAKLVLTGEDRVRWLNGMVTNNIRDLAVGHGVYNFLLNAQGRILGDLVAYNRGDYLLVTTDRAQAAAITEVFDRYIIMDDVEVADISDKLSAVGLAGPQATEILQRAGIEFPQLPKEGNYGPPAQLAPGQVVDIVWRDMGISVARDTHPNMDGYEIWFAAEQADRGVGCAGCSGCDSGRQRGPGVVSHCARGAALRPRPEPARLAAGDRAEARAELHQGLLHRAGDRGAHSRPRHSASHVHGIRGRGRAAASRHKDHSRTTRTLARSPAQRACRSRAESARWPWAICAASSRRRARSCRSASRRPRCSPFHSSFEQRTYGRQRKARSQNL